MLDILIYIALTVNVLFMIKTLLFLVVLYIKKVPFTVGHLTFKTKEEVAKMKLGTLGLLLVLLVIAWHLVI